jgi:hypothetical protein
MYYQTIFDQGATTPAKEKSTANVIDLVYGSLILIASATATGLSADSCKVASHGTHVLLNILCIVKKIGKKLSVSWSESLSECPLSFYPTKIVPRAQIYLLEDALMASFGHNTQG